MPNFSSHDASSSDDFEHVVHPTIEGARHFARLPGRGRPPFERVTTHIRLYDAAASICQLAADVEADLVVVGTYGHRGAKRFLVGSIAEATVRLAPCPVLVVRPRGVTIGSATKIEPPCPKCLETRRKTGDREFWCATRPCAPPTTTYLPLQRR